MSRFDELLSEGSFDEVAEASKNGPRVLTESVPDPGETALIGVITQGKETHVGGGALAGNLIINATMQSYDGTKENKNKVAELIRAQAAYAETAQSAGATATPAT